MSILNLPLLKSINDNLLLIKPSNTPNKSLFWKESLLHSQTMNMKMSHDGFLWFVGRIAANSGDAIKLSKTQDINNTAVLVSGVTFDFANWGSPQSFLPQHDGGIVIVTNITVDEIIYMRVYKFASINDDSPVLKYEKANVYHTSMFGADFYSDGIKTITLIGTYSMGDTIAKDLLLSVDAGVTFTVVYSTESQEIGGNYHIHDVCVDPKGILWFATGDGGTRNNLFFSLDLGTNWKALKYNDGSGAVENVSKGCPIVAFPELLISGRDDTRPCGFDVFYYPNTINGWDDFATNGLEMVPGKTFSNVQSQTAFMGYTAKYGTKEAIISEAFHTSGLPVKSWMTLDGGHTWHIVNVSGIVGTTSGYALPKAIDANYVYGTKNNSGVILYAPKPVI